MFIEHIKSSTLKELIKEMIINSYKDKDFNFVKFVLVKTHDEINEENIEERNDIKKLIILLSKEESEIEVKKVINNFLIYNSSIRAFIPTEINDYNDIKKKIPVLKTLFPDGTWETSNDDWTKKYFKQ